MVIRSKFTYALGVNNGDVHTGGNLINLLPMWPTLCSSASLQLISVLEMLFLCPVEVQNVILVHWSITDVQIFLREFVMMIGV